MKIRYFYIQKDSGEIQGPFTASTLDKLYKEYKMSGQTMISPDKTDWRSLEEFLYPPLPSEEKIPMEQESPQADSSLENSEETETIPKIEIKAPDSLPDSDENNKEKPLCPIFLLPDDPAEITGAALQLIWNTTDNLKKLGEIAPREIFSKVLPVSFSFSLLLTLAAALSVACFYGGTLHKLIFVLGIVLCNMLLAFLEILCFPNKNDTTSEFMKKAVILSSMLWINFSTVTCIIILQLALFMLPEKTVMQECCIYFSSIFSLFSCFFSISNIGIGLRTGLCSFFACRPHVTVWFSAFLLSQYCGIVILAVLIAKKILA